MREDLWLLVISGDPFKQVDTNKPTHTYCVSHTLTRNADNGCSLEENDPNRYSWTLCSVVVWHFRKWIVHQKSLHNCLLLTEALCSALTSHSEPRAFTRCRVKLCELMEMFRGKVLCVMPMPAHSSQRLCSSMTFHLVSRLLSFDQRRLRVVFCPAVIGDRRIFQYLRVFLCIIEYIRKNENM